MLVNNQLMTILGTHLVEPEGLSYIDWMKWVWSQWEVKAYGVNLGVECMECLKTLQFSPYHVAHILSVGTEKQMERDYYNVIPLCVDCHNIFDGKQEGLTRHDMILWPQIQEMYVILKTKYRLNDIQLYQKVIN